jgi:nucleoside-diphosphate-sugar epimerase
LKSLKSKIVVLGSEGYIGTALIQRLLIDGYDVVGVDDLSKNRLAEEIGTVSVTTQLDIEVKHNFYKKIGSFRFHAANITQDVYPILDSYNIDTIVNLAQQPSAPFSHLNLDKATYTMINNSIGTLNILWWLKNKDIHYIEIESLGTFQPDINTKIPENLFQFFIDGRQSVPSIFPKRPGSLYHLSKVTNTYLCDMANRWWNQTITSINQGIVYGLYTPEIEDTRIFSPLWVDEHFGTVVNRLCAQKIINHPLTIYGTGNQKRGFIALADSINCLMLFIKNPPRSGDIQFPNQKADIYSINEIASFIGSDVRHIKTPRKENTEEYYYNPETEILKKLGYQKTREIKDEIEYILSEIDYSLVEKNKSLFIPKTLW